MVAPAAERPMRVLPPVFFPVRPTPLAAKGVSPWARRYAGIIALIGTRSNGRRPVKSRAEVSLPFTGEEVQHPGGQGFEEFGRNRELALIEAEFTLALPGRLADGPHLGDRPVAAAQDEGFPCLDTLEVA